jgi:hypothetical protein
MPRLIVGKMVRAAVPVPWAQSPPPAEFAAFLCRFMVQLSFLALIPYWWPQMNRTYVFFLAALILCHVITTVIFYGSARFSYCFLEIFFVPCIFCGIEMLLSRRLSGSSRFSALAVAAPR